ncbi:hypothetical protein GCM10027519_06030 [Kineococcus endophyticus]
MSRRVVGRERTTPRDLSVPGRRRCPSIVSSSGARCAARPQPAECVSVSQFMKMPLPVGLTVLRNSFVWGMETPPRVA